MKNHQAERDEFIVDFHTEPDSSGLNCPLCGRWSPLQLDSPQGVRMVCDGCGLHAIMPRVQLVRAIKYIREERA
jgi:hypothetical protein